jgi:hypothetical protein
MIPKGIDHTSDPNPSYEFQEEIQISGGLLLVVQFGNSAYSHCPSLSLP